MKGQEATRKHYSPGKKLALAEGPARSSPRGTIMRWRAGHPPGEEPNAEPASPKEALAATRPVPFFSEAYGDLPRSWERQGLHEGSPAPSGRSSRKIQGPGTEQGSALEPQRGGWQGGKRAGRGCNRDLLSLRGPPAAEALSLGERLGKVPRKPDVGTFKAWNGPWGQA